MIFISEHVPLTSKPHGMKTTLFTLFTFSLFLTGFSQEELRFELHGKYSRSVHQEALKNAKAISDFMPGYPVNWITSYAYVEITGTSNGKVVTAKGSNDILNAEQQNILKTADLNTNIFVDVRYKYKEGTMSHNEEDNRINVVMTVVPETEAEYSGGKEQMQEYLKENVISKIAKTLPKDFGQRKVIFTVNEEGEIVNAKIFEPSPYPQTDKLMVEAINKMPNWKPAQNAEGVKVKQEFEFSVGAGGC